MAKTKIDIKAEGQAAYRPWTQCAVQNPYKPDSWQANAWSDGYRAAKQEAERLAVQAHGTKPLGKAMVAFKSPEEGKVMVGKVMLGDTLNNPPRDTSAGVSIPFPARMPSATRQHIRCLETSIDFMAGNAPGNTLLRYAKKIEALYARWQ